LADGARYTQSVLVVLIDRQLKVRVIKPTPAQQAAVDKLSQYDKPDFDKRLSALLKIKASRKGSKS
jgi:hypothetical protein